MDRRLYPGRAGLAGRHHLVGRGGLGAGLRGRWLGAKKAGASRLALLGAAVGTVLGLFMGLVGVHFMPFVGAAVGEWWTRRGQSAVGPQAVSLSFATWVGIMAGRAAKRVISCVMVGLFAAALLF